MSGNIGTIDLIARQLVGAELFVALTTIFGTFLLFSELGLSTNKRGNPHGRATHH